MKSRIPKKFYGNLNEGDNPIIHYDDEKNNMSKIYLWLRKMMKYDRIFKIGVICDEWLRNNKLPRK